MCCGIASIATEAPVFPLAREQAALYSTAHDTTVHLSNSLHGMPLFWENWSSSYRMGRVMCRITPFIIEHPARIRNRTQRTPIIPDPLIPTRIQIFFQNTSPISRMIIYWLYFYRPSKIFQRYCHVLQFLNFKFLTDRPPHLDVWTHIIIWNFLNCSKCEDPEYEFWIVNCCCGDAIFFDDVPETDREEFSCASRYADEVADYGVLC